MQGITGPRYSSLTGKKPTSLLLPYSRVLAIESKHPRGYTIYHGVWLAEIALELNQVVGLTVERVHRTV